jgi:ribosomal RNA-processing protein 8
VAKWPLQPVEAAAAYLRKKSKKLVVADFGCGTARLAALARQKVHSLDLVSTAPHVIACNMAHTPLGACCSPRNCLVTRSISAACF